MTARPIRFVDAFDSVVERHGDLIAIEDEAGTLTYRELQSASRAYADGLIPGTIVPVRQLKNRHAIIALLGIWYAGAIYLPLDPDWPEERTSFIRREIERADTPLDEQVAYLIYTSGSTGEPKGVLISHRGILPVLRAQIAELGLGPGKRCLLILSMCFDASLSDIGTCLLSGATLVLNGTAHDLEALRITHVDLPPAMLRLLEPRGSLEHVIVGGEVCAPETLRAWTRKVRVTIAYGPTEATICTSMARCTPRWNRPLIGRPIAGARYEIVDDELLISGPGLALGYFQRPDLDRERFRVDTDGTRWFRTRDRVRRSGEDYEFLGRLDRQLKVRGMLVAPEEIETRLLEDSTVKRAAVLDAHGLLVAYVETTRSAADLRHHCRSLPTAMRPQRFEIVDRIDLLPSGKPDFEALRRRPLHRGTIVPPVGPTEEALVATFAEVLAVENVSRDDDFFALGGDSFKVLELVTLAKTRGLVIAPASLWNTPVVSDLAHVIDDERRTELEKRTAQESVSAAELATRVMYTSTAPAAKPNRAMSTLPQHVFVTGATGFLGARVVREWLERVDGFVTCLVRAPSVDHARVRLTERIGTSMHRIRIVLGDVARPRLGLAEVIWDDLAEHVTDIFHFAASVDMVRPFAELAAVNVDGTLEILRLRDHRGTARLHYASTLSVFASTDRATGTHSTTKALDQSANVHGGYAQTKWVAELACTGTASIHRFGLLTSMLSPFAPPRGCQLTMFLRGLRKVGALPERIDLDRYALDVTPVDYAARAFVELTTRCGTFHIANPRKLSLAQIVLAVERQNRRKLDRVSMSELATRAARHGEDGAMLYLSFARPSTNLFLATDADFDPTPLPFECPSPEAILEAHL